MGMSVSGMFRACLALAFAGLSPAKRIRSASMLQPEFDQAANTKWILGSTQQNCNSACSSHAMKCAGDSDFLGWPQSKEAVKQIAHEMGIKCTSFKDQCYVPMAPVYRENPGWCVFASKPCLGHTLFRCDTKSRYWKRMCPCTPK